MVRGHMFHHTSRDVVTVVVLKHQAAHRAVKPLHHTIESHPKVLVGLCSVKPLRVHLAHISRLAKFAPIRAPASAGSHLFGG